MATSGTATFNYNRDQIVKAALRKIGAIASSETPDANTLNDASDQLNIMVKAWNATGIHIWTETEATLFLQPSQIVYTLGSTSSDHATSTYYSTTISAAEADAQTTLSVTSTDDMTVGDHIGIVVDDGTIHWSTISSKTSSTVTIADALDDSAAAGNPVYNYTAKIIRPMRVVAARNYTFASAQDIPMNPVSRLDYRAMPSKTTTGVPVNFFYDPRGGKNTEGQLYVWPAPADATSAVNFTWYRPLEDFTSAANNPDLPAEWLDTLIWNLALKMAPEYDVPSTRYAMIEKHAMGSLDLALGWDREIESVMFSPGFE